MAWQGTCFFPVLKLPFSTSLTLAPFPITGGEATRPTPLLREPEFAAILMMFLVLFQVGDSPYVLVTVFFPPTIWVLRRSFPQKEADKASSFFYFLPSLLDPPLFFFRNTSKSFQK